MGVGKALIVDDAEMNAELLSEMVSDFGLPSDIASNGEEALELMRQNTYSIVFMDHLMPVMDGVETMKIIKKERINENTPVIMITADDENGDRDFYLDVGFSGYMSKPFSAEKICGILKRFSVCCRPEDEWEELYSRFSFLKPEKSKYYCLSDSSLYIQLLREYVKSDILLRLEKAIKNENIGEKINVLRDLKNNARLVGATDLAIMALDVEKNSENYSDDDFDRELQAVLKTQKKIFTKLSKVLL